MGKIFLIIQREYLSRVKKKSFIIITLLAPIGFAFFFGLMIWLAQSSISTQKVVVVDETGWFSSKNIQDSKSIYFNFSDAPIEVVKENYIEDYAGYIYIPKKLELEKPDGIIFGSEKQPGIKAKMYIEKEFKDAISQLLLKKNEIDEEIYSQLKNLSVSLITEIKSEGGSKAGSSEIAMIIGYIMGFIIYIVMFIYGTMVMRGVAEEKTNRIIEVIASTVKPIQLMMGKIIGIGAVGLTQFMLWGILFTVLYLTMFLFIDPETLQALQQAQPGASSAQMDEQEMLVLFNKIISFDWTRIFFYFLFYFLGGYLLYGALFAAIGSAVNEEGEGQSLNIIVSMPIIASIVIMTTVVQEPESSLAIWTSIIPFTSPIVMLARIPFEPDLWQIVLSMVMLVLGFIGTTWLAAKIYRVGILMTGKKVSLREIAKWIRYSG